MLTGHHLIAGQWVAGQDTFISSPASGDGFAFATGTPANVDAAARAAEAAFPIYSALPREVRAQFLEEIAAQIDARGDAITAHGSAETGLPEARLVGERGRTTGQLRLFAAHIRKDGYLDLRRDAALPDRTPLPRFDKVADAPVVAMRIDEAQGWTDVATGRPVGRPHLQRVLGSLDALLLRPRAAPLAMLLPPAAPVILRQFAISKCSPREGARRGGGDSVHARGAVGNMVHGQCEGREGAFPVPAAGSVQILKSTL
jgi:hypothetical protein